MVINVECIVTSYDDGTADLMLTIRGLHKSVAPVVGQNIDDSVRDILGMVYGNDIQVVGTLH